MVSSVGIVGGTGGLGRGLAGRFAVAGIDVLIGSRDATRAREAAARTVDALDRALAPSAGGGPPGDGPGGGHIDGGHIDGAANADVLATDLVVVALPAEALETNLPDLEAGLRGRIVVSTVNPLGFDDDGPYPIRLPAGSAAATIAAALPGARVTAAFHTVSSHHLERFAAPMDDDVPVVGDDEDAVEHVLSVVQRIPGLRGVAAGPLRLAAPLEDLTPVLIAINQRARRHVGVRFSRLPDLS